MRVVFDGALEPGGLDAEAGPGDDPRRRGGQRRDLISNSVLPLGALQDQDPDGRDDRRRSLRPP